MSDRDFRHALMHPSAQAHEIRIGVYSKLKARGLVPSPSLVADVVTVAIDGCGPVCQDCSRPAAMHAARCMAEVRDAVNSAIGIPLGSDASRTESATQFLISWMAGAPRPANPQASLTDLDSAAIACSKEDGFSQDPWVTWRASEERAFENGGSPEFRRALTEIRSNAPLGFGAIDERIWFISSDTIGQARNLDLASRHQAGQDGQPIRRPIGEFRETGFSGIPDDPTRICPSDLALLGLNRSDSRAILAMKIADSQLMVRFGHMPHPARQRPRVLLVVAICDTVMMHVQPLGGVVPDIEPLRESIFHALTACMCTLTKADVDFEVEVRRDGPIANGRLRIRELRNRHGRLRLEFRHPRLLLEKLSSEAPWLFSDTPMVSNRPLPPMLTGFDAAYLIAVGSTSALRESCNWTISAVAEVMGPGLCEVSTRSVNAQTTSSLAISKLQEIANALAKSIGEVPQRDDPKSANSSEPEGTVFL